MEDPTRLIGYNLKKLRQKNKLSLDLVAELTGISKGMLSQIERGKSNPTVSTLWKIATGLKIPFSAFMENDKPTYEIISCADSEPLLECDGKMKIHPFFPFDAANHFEILYIALEPGCFHQSPRHADGVSEYIFVFAGRLQLTLGETTLTLETGQALKFSADLAHAYANLDAETCTFQNLIVYPK